MKLWVRNSGLTLTLLVMFLCSFWGQFYFGFQTYNQDLQRQGAPPLLEYAEYLNHGHFWSSIGENWESEFLQMAFFVLLTAFLYQKGSSESKSLPEQQTQEEVSEQRKEEDYRRKKMVEHPISWRLFENSLTLVLFCLFLVSFYVHMLGSFKLANEERARFHEPMIGTVWGILSDAEFWFESFQNWQSEFFSIAVLLVLSIYLRQRGSPQSKKLYDLNSKTGTD